MTDRAGERSAARIAFSPARPGKIALRHPALAAVDGGTTDPVPHRCRAFGIGIRSAWPLPELPCDREVASDVTISLGPVRAPSEAVVSGRHFVAGVGETLFWWDDVGHLVVRGGAEIEVAPRPDADPIALREALLGPAIAAALQQRGRLVLHGSAISVGNRAVALLAHSGAGKSTLAAALWQRGHPFLADDLAVLDVRDDAIVLWPAFPQVKLTAAAIRRLTSRDPRHSPVADVAGRKHWLATGEARSDPLPLAAIFLLARRRGAPQLQSLSPLDATMRLIGHSFCARIVAATGIDRHFRQCATVADRIPVYRLHWRRTYADLAPAIAAIEAAVDRLPTPLATIPSEAPALATMLR